MTLFFPSPDGRDTIVSVTCRAFTGQPVVRQEVRVQKDGTAMARDTVSGNWTQDHVLQQDSIETAHLRCDRKWAPRFDGKDYTIVLDAGFDLHQAGEDSSPEAQEMFTELFEQAAWLVEERCDVEICVVRGSYDGPAMRQQSDNGDEGNVWQTVHDVARKLLAAR